MLSAMAFGFNPLVFLTQLVIYERDLKGNKIKLGFIKKSEA